MSHYLLKTANSNHEITESQRDEIIDSATRAYENFMDCLCIDWRNDPNSSDTPRRVAKSFVNDLMRGCYQGEPNITSFDNVDGYNGIVFQGNIEVVSMCSHHHLPFTGKAHVAYIPHKNGKVIGLSKLNRIVDFYARRGQVQENLTMQISHHIDKVCERNLGVAVVIEAKHSCCSNRGIGHDSTMVTAKLTGVFLDNNDKSRNEFYKFIDTVKVKM